MVTLNISGEEPTKRSGLVKNLLLAALVVVVIALSIAFHLKGGSNASPVKEDNFHGGRPLPQPKDPSHRQEAETCLTEDCIEVSARLYKAMNLSADPCNDFNEFACGRFHREFNLPEDKPRWSSFTPIGDLIYDRAKVILSEDEDSDAWESEKMARKLYKSCLDEEKLESIGTKPLQDFLTKLGGWPVINDNWNAQDFNWHEKVVTLANEGYSKDFFVQVFVGIDDRNSSYRSVFLDQPSLGMSREYLVKGFDDTDVQHYFTYMVEAAELLGADRAKAESEMKEVLMFEIKLAEASAPREERRNASKLYNPVILGEYTSLPGHPPSWPTFISDVVKGQAIDSGERVIVQNPAYVKKLSQILSETEPRVQANFIGWRTAKSVFNYLNQAARDIRQKYNKAINGINSPPPRWKTCAKAVGFNSYADSSTRVAAGSMYVRRHFSTEAKAAMLDMISYLRRAFADIITSLDWMDAATKARASDKLDKMRQFIAYPDEMLDRDIVDGFYGNLQIAADDYYGNQVRLSKWNRQFKYSRLRQQVDKDDWREHSLVALVNAFYNPSVNSMEFPAGILQGVFFNHKAPRYLNYGGIGAVIGHEITHGFDDQGRQYDADGNLQDWWEPSTKERFVSKTKCIIDQYGRYHNDQVDLNLNGVTTQGENIADNGGTKEAYSAYLTWSSETNQDEARLPGLDFNPRQLFWISWGQVWCTKYRDAAMKNQIKTGAHSPGMYRIMGPLSNSKDFARDFNCPRGSGMNPDNKCQVW